MSIMVCEPTIDDLLLPKLNRQSQDRRWINDNYMKLQEYYPGKYIAVEDGKVQYHSESVITLVAEIIRNGEKTDDYVIEHLPVKFS